MNLSSKFPLFAVLILLISTGCTDNPYRDEDIENLFLLDDNSDFSIALFEILVNRHEKNPNSLNSVQQNLFLCMHLENAGQADSILSFLQEWFPKQKKQVVKSLSEIGATKSAEIIEQAIALLPENNSWFFESSDENSERLMMKFDNEFSSYPGTLKFTRSKIFNYKFFWF